MRNRQRRLPSTRRRTARCASALDCAASFANSNPHSPGRETTSAVRSIGSRRVFQPFWPAAFEASPPKTLRAGLLPERGTAVRPFDGPVAQPLATIGSEIAIPCRFRSSRGAPASCALSPAPKANARESSLPAGSRSGIYALVYRSRRRACSSERTIALTCSSMGG